jgi:predicted nucleic acid-binding Zn ribbon protein
MYRERGPQHLIGSQSPTTAGPTSGSSNTLCELRPYLFSIQTIWSKRMHGNLPKTKAQRLAEALLRDRERERPKHNIVACLSCGRTFVFGRGKTDGQFCSTRCREWLEADNPSYEEQQAFNPFRVRTKIIAGKYREQEGRSRSGRACLECGARIPTWRKGRKVSGKTQFCSAACKQKSHRKGGLGPLPQKRNFVTIYSQKVPVKRGVLRGHFSTKLPRRGPSKWARSV